MAQRLFSVYAEYFDATTTEANLVGDEFNLLKWHLGPSFLWSIPLASDDLMSLTLMPGGAYSVTYPTTVTGSYTLLDDVVLTRDTTFEEFLYGAPTRLTTLDIIASTEFSIWDSAIPDTINDMVLPERLYIYAFNSTEYKKRTAFKHRLFNGVHAVTLIGRDLNRLDITETIEISDDGPHLTRNIWAALTEKPQIEGFDGDVEIRYKDASSPWIVDPYRLAATDEFEGPLKIRKEGIEETNIFYFTSRFKEGSTYRTGIVEGSNDEDIGVQRLKGSEGNDYVAVDMVISPENTLLYVLETNGMLHVYEHGLTPFSPTTDSPQTDQSRIELHPLMHYVEHGGTYDLFTYHARPRNKIQKVTITRRKPDDTTQYLQDDLTWGAPVNTFSGKASAVNAAESWDDLRIQNTYDQFGQWNFTIETLTESNEVTTYQTSVMCDYLTALVSLDTEVAEPTSICFGEDGNLLITDATNFYKIQQHRDTYFADAQKQELLVRESYVAVEVVP